MTTKLKYIQLDNGIELISEIDISDWQQTEMITLINPLKLFVLPPFLDTPEKSDLSGDQTMVLIKWIPWISGNVTIKVDKILISEDIDPAMVDHYKSTLAQYEELFKKPEQKFSDFMKNLSTESVESSEELTDLMDVINTLTKNHKKVLH